MPDSCHAIVSCVMYENPGKGLVLECIHETLFMFDMHGNIFMLLEIYAWCVFGAHSYHMH